MTGGRPGMRCNGHRRVGCPGLARPLECMCIRAVRCVLCVHVLCVHVRVLTSELQASRLVEEAVVEREELLHQRGEDVLLRTPKHWGKHGGCKQDRQAI